MSWWVASHFGAVMDTSVNVCVQVVHGHMFSFLLGLYQGAELPGHVVPPYLTF